MTARLLRCRECRAPLAHDQRYCVECGARRGSLPPAIAGVIAAVTNGALGGADAAVDGLEASELGASALGPLDSRRGRPISGFEMPAPSVVAVAVLALLAFGVLLGSAVSPVQQSGAASPLLLAVAPTSTPAQPSTVSEHPLPPPSPTPPVATPVAPVASAPVAATAPAKTPKASQPTAGGGGSPSAATALPPIKHVFLIVLSDQGAAAAFGPGSPAPYLSKTLPHEGELLENYYAVSRGELANAVALISGQGPNPQTAADCPLYSDVASGTVGTEGQVLGSGCVYPRQTLTLPDQLASAGKAWRAYVEDVEAGLPGEPTSCRHPALGAADANNALSPGHAYATWRNPFVYFHSLIDGAACARDDVGLGQLASDLGNASRAPSLAYIVPDRCHDGSEQPCAAGQPAGLAAAEAFLRKVVPEIQGSAAYKDGGLIAITFDQASQSGPGADSSGCCITGAYPNLPAATPPTTTTTASAPPTGSTATPTAGATTSAPTSTGPQTTAPNGATSPASSTTTGATPPPTTTGATGTQAATPTGGGKVGLLLISKYVKAGSLNVTGEYNHFALLRSIETLFGLHPLGYAGSPGLLAFDRSVFNASP